MNDLKKTEVSERRIVIPMFTLFKIVFVVGLVVSLKVLGPLILTLFLSTLLAVSLTPVLTWFVRKGLKKWLGVSLITVVLMGLIILIVMNVVPQLFEEAGNFIKNWPEYRENLTSTFSSSNPLKSVVEKELDRKSLPPTEVSPLWTAGGLAIGRLADLFLFFVFAIYLLKEGPNILNWISAFFPAETQQKINQTAKEVSVIISAYVTGQFITSVLCFIFVYISLTVLKVPSALLLAVLAGIFDILPVLGFFLAVIPAMLFAFSVSSSTPMIVFALYVFYHGIENYLIIPMVYGNRLRVSSFVVLLSLIIAGLLGGVKGAIAVLPIVASYSIIERIWLKKFLYQGTVEAHHKIEKKS